MIWSIYPCFLQVILADVECTCRVYFYSITVFMQIVVLYLCVADESSLRVTGAFEFWTEEPWDVWKLEPWPLESCVNLLYMHVDVPCTCASCLVQWCGAFSIIVAHHSLNDGEFATDVFRKLEVILQTPILKKKDSITGTFTMAF